MHTLFHLLKSDQQYILLTFNTKINARIIGHTFYFSDVDSKLSVTLIRVDLNENLVKCTSYPLRAVRSNLRLCFLEKKVQSE